MTFVSTFDRRLSNSFLDGLDNLTGARDGQWWRDVLTRRDLVIAIRDEYLNVYYRGASVFLVRQDGQSFVPLTHAKYLSRRKQGLVAVRPDGTFGIDPLKALWHKYEGPATLDEMIRAAADLAGPEKIGLHALLLASPHVVDVEVSLERIDIAEQDERTDGAVVAAEQEAEDASPTSGSAQLARRQDRLDVATLEERDGGTVFVVFHEAKHFTNGELRAGPTSTPPVAEQIARYRQTLTVHAAALAESYREVCKALVRFDAMRQQVTGGTPTGKALHPLIVRVARENILPQIDPEPRLVVFGFDQDQRDGKVWGRHRQRLERDLGIRLEAIGNTGTKRSPGFR